MVKCSIANWSAWTLGAGNKNDWAAWFDRPPAFEQDTQPDVSFLPKLSRRRLSRLSKMALYVAHHCSGEEKQLYTIFCSGRGEYDHTFRVLNEICDEEEVSPAAFGASVHNTSQGLFSIFQNNHTPSLFFSGRLDSLEQAVSVACLKLAENEKILVVYLDDILPDIYDPAAQAVTQPLALALMLEKAQGEAALSLVHRRPDDDVKSQEEDGSTSALSLIKLILKRGPSFQNCNWVWSMDHA